jgi:hypothetical protein
VCVWDQSSGRKSWRTSLRVLSAGGDSRIFCSSHFAPLYFIQGKKVYSLDFMLFMFNQMMSVWTREESYWRVSICLTGLMDYFLENCEYSITPTITCDEEL